MNASIEAAPVSPESSPSGDAGYRFVEVFRSAVIGSFEPTSACAGPTVGDLADAVPDAHWLALDARGIVRARCSGWWTNSPRFRGARTGLLGHYSAETARAGVALLGWACRQLAQKKCRVVVGPMDGSTWRSYRLVTWSNGESPFFLEPNHPEDWPEHFVRSGFTSIAEYSSTMCPDTAAPDPKASRARERLEKLGVTLRPFDLKDSADDLRAAHEISLVAFEKSFLFSPLPFDAFRVQYGAILPALRGDLLWLAVWRGRPVGFVFAMPDLAQQQRGEPVDRVVLKTMAIRPERELAGLGTWLSDHLRQVACSSGFRRVIHALIHNTNGSMNISRRTTTPIRGYTLFGRSLFGDDS